jgi:hypothetical protein
MPTRSASAEVRRPVTIRTTMSTAAVPAAAKAAAAITLMVCTPSSSALPYRRPSAPPALTAVVAKTPVSSEPTMPPTPWHANTSSVSSSAVRLSRPMAP